MKLRYIVCLVLMTLLAGASTGLRAQNVVFCEDFEGGYGTLSDWGCDLQQMHDAGYVSLFENPVFATGNSHSGTLLILAYVLNDFHGVTLTLPAGVDYTGYNLAFYMIYYFSTTEPGRLLIVGGMENDTAYGSFYPLDTIALEGGNFRWKLVTVSLDNLPAGYHTLGFRVHDGNVGPGQNMAMLYIDDVTVSTGFVGEMRVVGHDASSLTFDWEQIGDVHPRFMMKDNGGAATEVQYVSHPVTIDSLHRGHNYTFIVQATPDSLNVGCGLLSDSVTVFVPNDHGSCIAYDDFFCDNTQAFYGDFDNPYADTGFVNYGSGVKASRHTVHWDTTEMDPRTGGQLRAVPQGYMSSVRLGNWDIHSEAESMLYTVTVDTLDFDLILLRYAAVLENPGHTPQAQPHFLFELLDENYHKIDPTCGAADFVASSSLGWNDYNGILWKDWTTVGFSVKAYHGRTIHVRLTTFDCDAGAHFGYAYFVLDCTHSTINVSSCHGASTVTLTAPAGFTYRWKRSTSPAVISTQQSISVPIDGSLYNCQVSFVDRPECSFTISAQAVASHNEASIDTTVSFEDCTMRVVFHNSSILISGTDGNYDTTAYTVHARWDLGGGLTSTVVDTVVVYTQPGTYPVSLTSIFSDCEDVAAMQVVVPLPTSTNLDTSISACDSMIWRGDTVYYQQPSGGTQHLTLVDTFSYVNPYGCDSTVSLYLDLHTSYWINDTILFCFGDSLTYGGIVYAADTVFPLTYTSIFGCDSIRPLLLTHRPPLPPPEMLLYNATDTLVVGWPLVGCAEMPVIAIDSSRVVAWHWTFYGSGQQSASGSEQQAALGSGWWSIGLVRIDSVGCSDSVHLDSVAIVMPSPHAAFTVNPQRIPVFGDEVWMLNRSDPDTCTWFWYNSLDSATARDWDYLWPEVSTPTQDTVTLVATILHRLVLGDSVMEIFCADTATDTVTIFAPWLDFPNLVTPNGDGVNDVWSIVGLLEDGMFTQNELWIFNEWGVQIYHVRDISSPDQFWDPNERPCPDGTYFYRFMARSRYGIVKRNGVIEVIRH